MLTLQQIEDLKSDPGVLLNQPDDLGLVHFPVVLAGVAEIRRLAYAVLHHEAVIFVVVPLRVVEEGQLQVRKAEACLLILLLDYLGSDLGLELVQQLLLSQPAIVTLLHLIDEGLGDLVGPFNRFLGLFGQYINSVGLESVGIDNFVELEGVDLDGEADEFLVVPLEDEVVVGAGECADSLHKGARVEVRAEIRHGPVRGMVEVVVMGVFLASHPAGPGASRRSSSIRK